MTLTPEQEREIREAFPKARKLLEALCAPHDTPDDADHAWRECRRCLAIEEIGTKAGRLMAQSILAELDEARANELYWRDEAEKVLLDSGKAIDRLQEQVAALEATNRNNVGLLEVIEQIGVERDRWKDDAQRYAQNAEYQQEKREQAEAERDRLKADWQSINGDTWQNTLNENAQLRADLAARDARDKAFLDWITSRMRPDDVNASTWDHYVRKIVARFREASNTKEGA